MVTIDLKDAYFQIPIHPRSRKFLRFAAGGRAWQFKDFLLRPLHGTADIYPGYGSGSRFSTSSGCQDVAIPGRLADHGFLSRRSLPDKGHGPPTLSRVGDSCEFGKVELDSISIDGVPGNQDRVADFPGFADSLKDRKVLLNSRRISVLKGAVCKILESTTGSPRVVDAPSSRWPTSG